MFSICPVVPTSVPFSRANMDSSAASDGRFYYMHAAAEATHDRTRSYKLSSIKPISVHIILQFDIRDSANKY